MSNTESKVNYSASRNKVLTPSGKGIDESGNKKYQKAKNAIKEHNNSFKEQNNESMK